MTVRLLVDSTCDLSLQELEDKDIYMVPMNILFENDEYRDGVDIAREELYERIEKSQISPTTSQPSPEAFYKTYKTARDAGVETLFGLFLSSKLSGVMQSAMIAKNLFEQEYDDLEINLNDSL
ncbi:MAG: DegV family EDD domain-containing protein, partial [Candidatus Heimdallarchaeota archaeon]|nr:DegV family EDD domain-containing protein [Candidatus Heimdallarchaeota archaeon]MCK5049050.1 DegV family EDD domain-containing protein [Candidatus Heimdallarchaeota archaeon]